MAFQFPADPTVGQEFSAGLGITYQWDGTGWMAIKASGSAIELLAPPGVVMPYAGFSPFTGWLLCDGKLYAIDSLPGLFAVIGYTYGGSGANFNVPDLRGRVIAGLDNMGGAVAGRLTGTVASTLGGAGGSEAVTLTTATMPAHAHGIDHTHSINDPGHAHKIYADDHHLQANPHNVVYIAVGGSFERWSEGTQTGITIAAGGGTSTTTGSGGGHLNVQPTIVLNFIIKT